jgi:hypothetical protein
MTTSLERKNVNYVELLHFSHIYHVSLVEWTYCLLPATGGSSSRPGGATHATTLWNC